MGNASHSQSSFLGGEWSQTMQGRFDLLDYRVGLNVCLNMIPLPQGALTRRPGTICKGTTRGGKPALLWAFDVIDNYPLDIEFTDGFLRFFTGNQVYTNNDTQTCTGISNSSGTAVFTVAAAWATGTSVVASGLGVNNPLLQGRVFLVTKISSTTFSLADNLTNTALTYANCGVFVSDFNFTSLLEIATPYLSGSWSNVISVQAENQSVLLNGTAPQVLTMETPPTSTVNATFSFAPAQFEDGPYLDPFTGSICTYSAKSGNITLTFSFLTYSATTSYSQGDYVVYSGQGYQSKSNGNLNNTPSGSSNYWTEVNGGAPVGPNGFTSGDIGRHIRLFNEPSLWASGSTYSAGNVVTYNGAYYQSLAGSNTGNIPEVSPTDWALVTGAGYALWTWGRIIAVSGSGLISVSTSIGTMTDTAAAIDGTPSKSSANSASATSTVTTYNAFVGGVAHNGGDTVNYSQTIYECSHTFSEWSSSTRYGGGNNGPVEWEGNYYTFNTSAFPETGQLPSNTTYWTNLGRANPTNTNMWSPIGTQATATIDAYIGVDIHTSASEVQSVSIFPSTDQGFGAPNVTFNLYGSTSSPSGPENGTFLGSVNATQFQGTVSITSSDQSTSYDYLWIEASAEYTPGGVGAGSFTLPIYVSQIEFFTPNVANGSVVMLQLAGEPLLYASGTIVYTWAAGAFSNTVGWPTCGCYQGGRLWLGGAIPNRFDASNSDALFNFAPTMDDGTVGDSNGISFYLNSQGVNEIRWMEPDAQGILCGTQAQEWLVFATTLNAPLTPTTTDARPVTRLGVAATPPARSEHTVVFIQKKLRKIVEYFADVFSGKFTAPDLTEKCRHLTVGNLAQIKYQQEIAPTIWARCTDGTWFGEAYKRDTLMTSQGPTFIGAHRHLLGSNRFCTAISVGASEGGNLDALSMVTYDAGANIYYIETVSDIYEDTSSLPDANFLDSNLVPSSSSVTSHVLTLNGLWLLNGKTVQVTIGGYDAGQVVTTTTNGVTTTAITDFTVSNGSLTVPLDDGTGTSYSGLLTSTFLATNPPILVGFTYTSQGQLLRPVQPQEAGSRIGTALGMKKKHAQVAMLLNQAGGMSWGTSFSRLHTMNFRSSGSSQPITPGSLYSGVFWDSVDDDWSYDSRICWQITRPYPATVIAVEGYVLTNEKT